MFSLSRVPLSVHQRKGCKLRKANLYLIELIEARKERGNLVKARERQNACQGKRARQNRGPPNEWQVHLGDIGFISSVYLQEFRRKTLSLARSSETLNSGLCMHPLGNAAANRSGKS